MLLLNAVDFFPLVTEIHNTHVHDNLRINTFLNYTIKCFNASKGLNNIIMFWLYHQRPHSHSAQLNFLFFSSIQGEGALPLVQLPISFKICCFGKHSLYFLIFQQLSLKLIDNCKSGGAPSPCIEISLLALFSFGMVVLKNLGICLAQTWQHWNFRRKKLFGLILMMQAGFLSSVF